MKSQQTPRVFITGASSGIGEALAEWYASQGAQLVLVARRVEKLQGLAERLGSKTKVVTAQADVRDFDALKQAARRGIQALGGLDVVIANAGYGVMGDVETLGIQPYREQFETNVFGVLHTLYATLEPLRQSRGSFCIVGSVNGHLSLPGCSAYAMSKHAVRALSDSLWHELKPQGIRVTHVSPGFIATEFRQVNNQGRLNGAVRDPIPGWLAMPSGAAARSIARAIALGRREQAVTWHGWWVIQCVRFFPSWVHTLIRWAGIRARPASGDLPAAVGR